MAENDKKLEEMFGTNAPGPVGHSAADTGKSRKSERPAREEKQSRREKKQKAPKPEPVPEEPDERDYRPIRKSRDMRIGCLGGLMYFVFVLSVSVILACLAWMAAADVLALNKPDVEAVITLDESAFTEEEEPVLDDNGDPVLDENGQPKTKTVTYADIDYVAEQLKAAGLIEYKSLFKFYCMFSHASTKIDEGSYTLSTEFDYRALVKKMNQGSGAAVTVDVTFPEGFTLEQIFQRLEENNVNSYENLMKAAANFSYNYSFLAGKESGDASRLEGYLFPDTYTFFVYMEPSSAIGKFLDNYNRKITDEMEQQAADMGYTMDQIITIASMIEKEAANDSERAKIASVIYNRIREGMPLQLDCTITYITGKNEVTEADLQIDSPYNTYLYSGLPAGPICNPGLASIQAALNPESTSYYYYALDTATGTHQFFSDYASHQAFVSTQNYG